jgi:hypothetical protein
MLSLAPGAGSFVLVGDLARPDGFSTLWLGGVGGSTVGKTWSTDRNGVVGSQGSRFHCLTEGALVPTWYEFE